jgi:hypothetical protein
MLLYSASAVAAGPRLGRADVVIDGRVRIDAEVARTPLAQAMGLSGRASLEKGTGMLFPFDRAGPQVFWMKGMLIPLDILWILAGRIVAIEANVPPPSPSQPLLVYSHPADLVLEVPAGYTEEMKIVVGQRVGVRYRER